MSNAKKPIEGKHLLFFIILFVLSVIFGAGCSSSGGENEAEVEENSGVVIIDQSTNNDNSTTTIINNPPLTLPPTPDPETEPDPEPTPEPDPEPTPDPEPEPELTLLPIAERIIALSRDLTRESTISWHPRDLYNVRHEYEFALIGETLEITATADFEDQLRSSQEARDKVTESLISAKKAISDFLNHMDNLTQLNLLFVGNDQFLSEDEFIYGRWIDEFLAEGESIEPKNVRLLGFIDSSLDFFESSSATALVTDNGISPDDFVANYIHISNHSSLAFVYLRMARDIADFSEIREIIPQEMKERLNQYEQIDGRNLRTRSWEREVELSTKIIMQINRIQNEVREIIFGQ